MHYRCECLLADQTRHPNILSAPKMCRTSQTGPSGDILEDLHFRATFGGHRARLPACAQFLLSPHSRVFFKTCLFEFLQHAFEVHRSRVDFDATGQFGIDM